jgi:hypothetical protein
MKQSREELLAARRQATAAKRVAAQDDAMEAWAREVVKTLPPLTGEEIAKLRVIFGVDRGDTLGAMNPPLPENPSRRRNPSGGTKSMAEEESREGDQIQRGGATTRSSSGGPIPGRMNP